MNHHTLGLVVALFFSSSLQALYLRCKQPDRRFLCSGFVLISPIQKGISEDALLIVAVQSSIIIRTSGKHSMSRSSHQSIDSEMSATGIPVMLLPGLSTLQAGARG